jgi:hypothetical protein
MTASSTSKPTERSTHNVSYKAQIGQKLEIINLTRFVSLLMHESNIPQARQYIREAMEGAGA